jgi:hypothetical protein
MPAAVTEKPITSSAALRKNSTIVASSGPDLRALASPGPSHVPATQIAVSALTLPETAVHRMFKARTPFTHS